MSDREPMEPGSPEAARAARRRAKLRRRGLDPGDLAAGRSGLAPPRTALLLIALAGLYFWASSAECENLVRKRIIARIEAALGGRVEIASFRWRPLDLAAEADGLVIHGREARGRGTLCRGGATES